MKKLFLVLFCFISLSVYATEEVFMVQDNTTDFRSKVWYFGSNNMDVMDSFFHRFNYLYVERTISRDDAGSDFNSLRDPYRAALINLLNRGRGIAIPDQIFRVMIVCDDRYGVMLFWWNDTTPATIMGVGPGEKLMFRHFFELRNVW